MVSEKEVLEIPVECDYCGDVYDLNDEFVGEDWNKTISQLLTDKYGNDELVCPKCRKGVLNVTEEGTYKMYWKENKNSRNLVLEINSKNSGRNLLKVNNVNRHQITFDVIDKETDK
jgi:uncharacterized protein YbaR (Trm112 family)